MKKLLIAILAAGVFASASFTTNAQTLGTAGILNGGTNSVAQNTTNTYWSVTLSTNITQSGTNYTTNVVSTILSPAAFPMPYSHYVSIQPVFYLVYLTNLFTGSTNAGTIYFDNSLDGSHWNLNATNWSIPLVSATNGNIQSVAFSNALVANVIAPIWNLDNGGAIYWRVSQIQNPNANTYWTNLLVNIGRRNGL